MQLLECMKKSEEALTPQNASFKCPREDMGDKDSAHVKTVALKSPAHYGGGGGAPGNKILRCNQCAACNLQRGTAPGILYSAPAFH